MGIVQVNLPEDFRSTIDRQVAGGLAVSEADYVASLLCLYADHLDAGDGIAVIAERADDDFAAGRFVTVSTPEDGDALHAAAMARLHTRLTAGAINR
jgi:Arc/MetJ-type ribon-helix-helix transcriptional regulator